MSGEAEAVLVGRCYTRARRLPLVLGEISGFRLWGGPYTIPQLVTLVVMVGVMLLAYPLWGHFGLFDAVLLVGVPVAVSFGVRRLRVEGRNPLAAAASAVGLVFAPSQGKLAGRPMRAVGRPKALRGACTVTWQPAAPVVAPRARRAGEVVASALAEATEVEGRRSAVADRPRQMAGPMVLSGAAAVLRSRQGVRGR